MKKIKNKLISKKLIYYTTISIAMIGILIVTGKNYPELALSKSIDSNLEERKELIQIATNEPTIELVRTTTRSGELLERKTTEKKESEGKEKENTENKEKSNEEKVVNTKSKAEKSEEKATKTSSTKKQENKSSKENKKSTAKSKKISEVKISKSMDLSKRTGLSRKDFIKLMSGVKQDTSGFFENNAGTIYDLCEKYSINEIFFCGLISAESGWNIASNHRRTHNYISLMRNGKLISYSSVKGGLEVAAQKLHSNYLTPGGKFYHGKTLAGVKTNFCPSPTWVNLVYGRMQQIV